MVSPLYIFNKVTPKSLIRDQITPFAKKNKIQSVKTHNRFDYSVHMGAHLTNKPISMPLFWSEGKIISHTDSRHNLLLLLIQFTLYLSIIHLLYCCHSQIFQRHLKNEEQMRCSGNHYIAKNFMVSYYTVYNTIIDWVSLFSHPSLLIKKQYLCMPHSTSKSQ